MSYYYNDNPGCGKFCFICLVIFFVISCCVDYKIYYENPHWEKITVTDKNIDPNKDAEKWLIYTKNEVYCITDLVFSGFFESSDVYNTLEVGKTYNVYVSGCRWPVASGYKVIRKAKEVEQPK